MSTPGLIENGCSILLIQPRLVYSCALICVLPLQVSISGQAVVFIVRTMSWSLMARAGAWTYIAFFLAQVILGLRCSIPSLVPC